MGAKWGGDQRGRQAIPSLPNAQRTIKEPPKPPIAEPPTPIMLSPRKTPARPHPSLSYRPPAYLRALKVGLISCAAAAGLAVLWVVVWFTLASSMRTQTLAWVEQRRAEGFTVRYTTFELSGFPFMLLATIDEPGLGWPATQAPWAWQGKRLIMQARPWTPWRLRLALDGAHTVRLADAAGSTTYSGAAGTLTLDVVLGGGGPESGQLTVAGLDLSTAAGTPVIAVERADLGARRGFPEPEDYRASILDVDLTAAGIGLPGDLDLPLGQVIGALRLEAGVRGAVPAGPWRESLAKWRDDGGTVEVARLGLAYGPLDVRANGTMALDGDMQPIGAFTAKVEGFFPLVDALKEKGLVRARDAVTAKVVLGVLAKKPADGGPPTLNLPLTVQGRKVYAGPLALAEVPAIPW